mmetsp:Transcript_20936/g.54437  ORF Transcript_20936/g.54437 Transcript_20936/m.54437 type:complete len:209 (-) Transcript_20936:117-743(-)
MQSVVATLTVDPERADEWEALFLASADRVVQDEKGTLVYTLCRSPPSPNVFTVIELYKDKAALKHHGAKMRKSPPPWMPLVKASKLAITSVCGGIGPGLKANHRSATRAVVGHFVAKDGDAFEAAFGKLLSTDVHAKEPGNMLYCLSRNTRDNNKFVITELYSDSGAIAHHNGTPYFKAAQRPLGKLLEGRPAIQHFIVCPRSPPARL